MQTPAALEPTTARDGRAAKVVRAGVGRMQATQSQSLEGTAVPCFDRNCRLPHRQQFVDLGMATRPPPLNGGDFCWCATSILIACQLCLSCPVLTKTHKWRLSLTWHPTLQCNPDRVPNQRSVVQGKNELAAPFSQQPSKRTPQREV